MKQTFFYFFCLLATFDVLAQDFGFRKDSESQESPLEIFADETEWDRENNKVIARGNAKLKKNNDQIVAKEIIGFFEESEGKRHLAKVDAFHDVEITTPSGEIKGGDKGSYFTDTQYMIIEGPQLTLTSSKSETLQTTQKLEYWEPEKKAFCPNPVIIHREKDVIKSNQLTAFFTEDPATKQTKLSEANLIGDVEIVTPTQTANGEKGFYRPLANEAILEGNVILTQDGNVMKGQWCRSDLVTGHNLLRNTVPGSDVKGAQPVYGLLIPKSKSFQKVKSVNPGSN